MFVGQKDCFQVFGHANVKACDQSNIYRAGKRFTSSLQLQLQVHSKTSGNTEDTDCSMTLSDRWCRHHSGHAPFPCHHKILGLPEAVRHSLFHSKLTVLVSVMENHATSPGSGVSGIRESCQSSAADNHEVKPLPPTLIHPLTHSLRAKKAGGLHDNDGSCRGGC